MDEVPIDRLDLGDDPEILSAPIILPAWACGTSAIVTGFVPHAVLELEIDGAALPPEQAGFPDPVGHTFSPIGPLAAGQTLRARQIVDGIPSGWAAETVRDHREEFPAGPPRPQISPDPVFECGSRTGVANLLAGCNAWITADGAEVGRRNGAAEHQGINVNPDYGLDQRVRAFAELCGDPSPPSLEFRAGPPPNPLPAPGIDPVYDGADRIRTAHASLSTAADRPSARSGPGASRISSAWRRRLQKASLSRRCRRCAPSTRLPIPAAPTCSHARRCRHRSSRRSRPAIPASW